jgi:hypothetical protein
VIKDKFDEEVSYCGYFMTMNSLSNYDLTKEPLLDLLQDIKTGKIQLVDFQRSWCWTEERISEAIASVSLG